MRTNRAGWWALFISAAILSLYTHFVAMLTLAGFAVFALSHALLERRRGGPIGPVLWSSALAFGVIGVAWIPAIPMVARMLSAEEGFHHAVATSTSLSLINTIVLKYPGFEDGVHTFVASLAGASVIWSAFRAPRALLFFIGTFAVPSFLYAFFGYERASVIARFALPLMAAYAVATGAGLAAITFGIEALLARVWPSRPGIGDYCCIVRSPVRTIAFIRLCGKP